MTAAQNNQERPMPSLTIVILERSSVLRQSYQRCLENDGHRVITTDRWENLWAVVADERPNMVLLTDQVDRAGCTVCGYDACAQLKKQAAGELRPIVVMTATGQRPDPAVVERSKADALIEKPISQHNLLTTVRHTWITAHHAHERTLLTVASHTVHGAHRERQRL